MSWIFSRGRAARFWVLCAIGMALAACDNITSNSASPPAASPTLAPGGTAQATRPPSPTGTAVAGRGANLQPHITNFQVWQDFMPRVSSSGPPLLAIFSLVVDGGGRYTTSNTSGTITIERPSGEVIARASVTLNQQVDDLGMAQPGQQSLTFYML